MSVSRRILALVAALAALAAAAPSTAAARRTVPQGFFGVMWDGSVVNSDLGTQDSQWSLMAQTGVESVRATFSWKHTQPVARSVPDFTDTDLVVELAALHGISVLPVVIDTPDWAAAYHHSYSPPADAADFGDFLQALVVRYGPNGTFWRDHPKVPKRPIRYWQIWNEPHLSYRWYAKPGSQYAWPKGYIRLLKMAREVLSSADPGAKVVLGGLTNDSWDFLRVLYKHHARRYFDIAAIQTYTGSPRNALKAIRLFRRVMRRYHDARKPIWATETGWPAAVGRMHVPKGQRTLVTTDRGMARNLRTMFKAVATRRRRASYRVGRVLWYTWSSPYRHTSDIFDFAGLESYYRGNFEAKPALRAYRLTVRRYEGCAKDSFSVCKP